MKAVFIIASIVGISLTGVFGLWLASIQPQTPVNIVKYHGQSIEISGLESQVDGQKPVKFLILAHNFTGCTDVGVLVFREMHYHPPVLQKDFAPGCNDKTEQKIQEYEFPVVINATDFQEPGSYIVRASFFAGRDVYGDIEKKIFVTKSIEINNLPDDFGLIYSFGVGGKNVLDTKKKSYTIDMVCEPSTEISLALSHDELYQIWDAAHKNGFFDLTDFTESCDAFSNCRLVTPEQQTTITITEDGKTHSVKYRGSYMPKPDDGYAKFQNVENTIQEILDKKLATDILPQVKCGYQ